MIVLLFGIFVKNSLVLIFLVTSEKSSSSREEHATGTFDVLNMSNVRFVRSAVEVYTLNDDTSFPSFDTRDFIIIPADLLCFIPSSVRIGGS